MTTKITVKICKKVSCVGGEGIPRLYRYFVVFVVVFKTSAREGSCPYEFLSKGSPTNNKGFDW